VATHQELVQRQQELARQEQLLAEARSLYRRTQTPTLWPQGRQVEPGARGATAAISRDLREVAQRPAPLSQEVLELELPPKDKEKLQTEARRRVRHPSQSN